MTELRNLKSRIEELESDLRERDEEVKTLKDQAINAGSNGVNGDDNEMSKVRIRIRERPLFYGLTKRLNSSTNS